MMPLDYSFKALNVGDGACSILTASDGEIGVLDCGSWRSSGQRQADVLTAAIGRQLKSVTTLIVSHFDADHWRGLQMVPTGVERGLLPDSVTIRYPGLPRLAQRTVFAYMALKSIDESIGVRALDLLDA